MTKNKVKDDETAPAKEPVSHPPLTNASQHQHDKVASRTINTFPSDDYDTWTHEQLFSECKRRGLI